MLVEIKDKNTERINCLSDKSFEKSILPIVFQPIVIEQKIFIVADIKKALYVGTTCSSCFYKILINNKGVFWASSKNFVVITNKFLEDKCF